MDVGLQQDTTLPLPPADPGMVPYYGGILSMESQSSIEKRDAARDAALEANNKPYIQGLAAHVRECWSAAYNAKRTTNVEDRMLRSVRQRRGEYDPDVLAEIRKTGGSEIYMMVSSNKGRAAASWLRDVLLAVKDEKPWTIKPSPMPDLPPVMMQSVQQIAVSEAQAYQQATGMQVQPQDMEKIQTYIRDRVVANARKRAQEACERMELKMEDQLAEGGYARALSGFIDDIVTFPSAFIEGPVVRNKKQLSWTPMPDGSFKCDVTPKLSLEWERVDPFMVYPMPHCTDIDDGGIFVRRRLTRSQLLELKGVEGYNNDAIDTVLDEHGKGGLHEWYIIDAQKATVEGKSVAAITANPEATIDALQYRGSVQGKMLVDWGMDESAVPDQNAEYPCEVWQIGQWVIKAMLNSDPLGRKNIYKASYEEIPGVFWGNSVMDLCRDVQSQCNTAARAMANNMGIGSGPQVIYNVDRLPTGEDLTQMYPWKIWQTTSDPYGGQGKPVEFFAPPMISGELMQIYMFFSNLADEVTGIPRYMTGDATGSGALRTSSGMSMLMGNASKGIKQVVGNIDVNVTELLIDRLWFYNMYYGDDPELKGDIQVVARGAASLVAKEAQLQRSNEFMQIILNSPVVGQIVGEEALIDIIRENAKQLGMADKLPPAEVIRARMYQQQQSAAQQQKAAQEFQMAMALAPSHEVQMQRGPDGEMIGATIIDKQQHVLAAPQAPMGGAMMGPGGSGMKTMSNPNQLTGNQMITDHFSPQRGV